jgi:2-polyprenyl-3-methyl-5-hydroxy-6-metoxy-1,4-benzoquinol methylase
LIDNVGSTAAVQSTMRSTLEARARQSLGSSSDAIYRLVDGALDARHAGGGRLIDVGCGAGGLWRVVAPRFGAYCGVDAVRYAGLPVDAEFHHADLDDESAVPQIGTADVVAAVETIEHLQNPWAFMRTLTSLAKSGGWIIVTTPNQLSLLSLMTLAVKHRFSAFQDAHYPAHRTALLECDLRRAAAECGLDSVEISYSLHGRVPLTPWHYPIAIARLFPRALSDNLMLVAKKKHA